MVLGVRPKLQLRRGWQAALTGAGWRRVRSLGPDSQIESKRQVSGSIPSVSQARESQRSSLEGFCRGWRDCRT